LVDLIAALAVFRPIAPIVPAARNGPLARVVATVRSRDRQSAIASSVPWFEAGGQPPKCDLEFGCTELLAPSIEPDRAAIRRVQGADTGDSAPTLRRLCS